MFFQCVLKLLLCSPVTCGTTAMPDIQRVYDKVTPSHVSLEEVITVAAIESNFKHSGSLSEVGAYGIMQIMSITEKDFASRKLDRRDLHDNLEIGIRYLDKMKQRFGSTKNMLIAYNWGPGNFVNKYRKRGKLPKETSNYVSRFNKIITKCKE